MDETAEERRVRRNEQARERRRANPEKYLAQERDYRKRHREELNERARAYRENNPERVKESQHRHRHESREWHRQEYRKLKREVIQAYGGKCACCGEQHEAFLTIDHYYNNGSEHRHKGGRLSGVHIYRFLKKEGFPKDGYQLLCANCNFAKQHDPEGHRAAHPNAINIEYHGEKQTLRKSDSQ